jgi:redox-sensitive bicupin YhaK (pirin superfamily)
VTEDFVLRSGERGYSRLVSTGRNASYIAGHPEGAITRWSSFNFHEYQSGLPGFGPVRVFGDEVFTGNGTGYNMHPHHNFIIMAVVLQGTLTHINTIGKIDVLNPGDYYVFSAGSGGKHCELNIEQEDLNVVYIWLLPDRLMTQPSYLRSHYDAKSQASRLACLVGATPGALPVRQDLQLHRLTNPAGNSCRHNIGSGRGVYLFVLEGRVRVGDTRLDRRDSIGLTSAGPIEIASETDGADILLIDTTLGRSAGRTS